jgi:hypothetical protein
MRLTLASAGAGAKKCCFLRDSLPALRSNRRLDSALKVCLPTHPTSSRDRRIAFKCRRSRSRLLAFVCSDFYVHGRLRPRSKHAPTKSYPLRPKVLLFDYPQELGFPLADRLNAPELKPYGLSRELRIVLVELPIKRIG